MRGHLDDLATLGGTSRHTRGDVGLGWVDVRHQGSDIMDDVDCRRINTAAALWLSSSAHRTSLMLRVGTPTLLISGLDVARRSSSMEKRSSLIFSPGRSPV